MHFNVQDTLFRESYIDLMSRVFTRGLGDRGSIPGRVIPKTQKMVPLCRDAVNVFYSPSRGMPTQTIFASTPQEACFLRSTSNHIKPTLCHILDFRYLQSYTKAFCSNLFIGYSNMRQYENWFSFLRLYHRLFMNQYCILLHLQLHTSYKKYIF